MIELSYKTPPWTHQRHALRKAIALQPDYESCMQFMGMGTGKSKVVVDYVKNMGIPFTLICSPKSVTNVWPIQFGIHSDGIKVHVATKGKNINDRLQRMLKQARLAYKRNQQFVAVINYEAVWRDPLATWLREKSPFSAIICDESHRIKAHNSKTSLFLYGYGNRKVIEHKLCLTGTPMPKDPLDWFGQLRFMNETIAGSNYWSFRNRLAIMGGFNGKQVVGFKDTGMDWLNERVVKHSFICETEDVLDLPESKDVDIPVELKPKAKRMYKEMARDFVTFIKELDIEDATEETLKSMGVEADNAMVKMIRLQQITSGTVRTPDGRLHAIGDEKLEAILDMVKDFPRGEPFVIFTRFKPEVQRLYDELTKLGVSVSRVTGDHDEYMQFYNGETQCMIANERSGSEGLDFTRACYAFYYSVGHSNGVHDQTRRRLNRPGQKRPVTYYHLIADAPIDKQIYRSLQKKENVIRAVVKAAKEGQLEV